MDLLQEVVQLWQAYSASDDSLRSPQVGRPTQVANCLGSLCWSYGGHLTNVPSDCQFMGLLNGWIF